MFCHKQTLACPRLAHCNLEWESRKALGVDGLSRWYEPEASRSKPLKHPEVRYSVPAKRSNPSISDDVDKVRYCVYDMSSKKTRFEVPTFSVEHPVLCLSADEGPKDLPAQYFLSANGFRAVFLMDHVTCIGLHTSPTSGGPS